MATLKLGNNYFNTYEQQKSMLSSNRFFNDDDWVRAAKTGELDQYINALTLSNDVIKDADKFNETYNTKFANSDTRLAALYNEVYADRDKLVRRERPLLNESGAQIVKDGVPQYEDYEITDYDYYKEHIKQQNDALQAKYEAQLEQERKDGMSAIVKGLATVPAIATETISGFLKQIDNLSSSIVGAVNAFDKDYNNPDGNLNYIDRLIKNYGKGDARIFDDFIEELERFEERYSYMRDLDGNYTGFGKYAGGVATSLGQMAPSMLVSMGLGKLGAPQKLIEALSTSVFYQGITVQNIQEAYQKFEATGTTYSTTYILTNSLIKSTLQAAIEIGLAKVLGGTALDNVMFGRSAGQAVGKTLKESAWRRLAGDAFQEGMEEFLQDTSDFLVDRAYMALDKNFGTLTDWSWSGIMDSFIIGAMSSIAGSTRQILFTKKQSFGDTKLSKLESWERGFSVQSLFENYQNVLKYYAQLDTENLSEEKKAEILNDAKAQLYNMYTTYRFISGISATIGETRFKAANNILTELDGMIADGQFNDTVVKDNIAELATNIIQDYSLDDSVYNLLASKKLNGYVATYKSNEISMDYSVLRKIFNNPNATLNEKLEAIAIASNGDVVLTKHGEGAIKFEPKKTEEKKTGKKNAKKVTIVPQKFLEGQSVKQIFDSLSEDNIQEHIEKVISAMPEKELLILKTLYKTIKGEEPTTSALAVTLLFDTQFVKTALYRINNKAIFDVISAAGWYVNGLVAKDIENKAAKDHLQNALDNIKNAIAEYFIERQQPVEHIPEFMSDKYSYIHNKRYSKDVSNKVIDGFNSLTDNDWKMLEQRVNGMAVEETVQASIKANLKSNVKARRMEAILRISNYYKGEFDTKYNGIDYMPMDCDANSAFNIFLENHGLTLDTILNENGVVNIANKQNIIDAEGSYDVLSIQSYWNNLLRKNSNVEFEYNADTQIFTVVDSETRKELGYSNYSKVISKENRFKNVDKFKGVTATYDNRNIVLDFVNPLIPEADRVTMTINDVINHYDCLRQEVKDDIVNNYGELNRTNTFAYLRRAVLDGTDGEVSIIVQGDGTYIFGTVTEFAKKEKKGAIDKMRSEYWTSNGKAGKTRFSITNIFSDITYGRAANTQIVIDTLNKNVKSAYYDPAKNEIHIDKNYIIINDINYLRFLIYHEYQHALQFENCITEGLPGTWLFSNSINKTNRAKVVADIKKHRPELFKDSKNIEQDEKIANDFVYNASGEYMANGYESSNTIDFVPIAVESIGNRLMIRMPWGTTYALGSGSMVDLIVNDVEKVDYSNKKDYLQSITNPLIANFMDNNTVKVRDYLINVLTSTEITPLQFAKHLADTNLFVANTLSVKCVSNDYKIPLNELNISPEKYVDFCNSLLLAASYNVVDVSLKKVGLSAEHIGEIFNEIHFINRNNLNFIQNRTNDYKQNLKRLYNIVGKLYNIVKTYDKNAESNKDVKDTLGYANTRINISADTVNNIFKAYNKLSDRIIMFYQDVPDVYGNGVHTKEYLTKIRTKDNILRSYENDALLKNRSKLSTASKYEHTKGGFSLRTFDNRYFQGVNYNIARFYDDLFNDFKHSVYNGAISEKDIGEAAEQFNEFLNTSSMNYTYASCTTLLGTISHEMLHNITGTAYYAYISTSSKHGEIFNAEKLNISLYMLDLLGRLFSNNDNAVKNLSNYRFTNADEYSSNMPYSLEYGGFNEIVNFEQLTSFVKNLDSYDLNDILDKYTAVLKQQMKHLYNGDVNSINKAAEMRSNNLRDLLKSLKITNTNILKKFLEISLGEINNIISKTDDIVSVREKVLNNFLNKILNPTDKQSYYDIEKIYSTTTGNMEPAYPSTFSDNLTNENKRNDVFNTIDDSYDYSVYSFFISKIFNELSSGRTSLYNDLVLNDDEKAEIARKEKEASQSNKQSNDEALRKIEVKLAALENLSYEDYIKKYDLNTRFDKVKEFISSIGKETTTDNKPVETKKSTETKKSNENDLEEKKRKKELLVRVEKELAARENLPYEKYILKYKIEARRKKINEFVRSDEFKKFAKTNKATNDTTTTPTNKDIVNNIETTDREQVIRQQRAEIGLLKDELDDLKLMLENFKIGEELQSNKNTDAVNAIRNRTNKLIRFLRNLDTLLKNGNTYEELINPNQKIVSEKVRINIRNVHEKELALAKAKKMSFSQYVRNHSIQQRAVLLEETGINTKNMRSPETSRYLSKKKEQENKDSNILNFGLSKPYTRNEYDKKLYKFINSAEEGVVPKRIWAKIKKGTLRLKDVKNYLTSEEELSQEEFDLIKNSIFENSKISSFDELKELSDLTNLQTYYAFYAALKELNLENLAHSKLTTKQINEIANSNKKLLNTYLKYSNKFGDEFAGTGADVGIDKQNIRFLVMKDYDGTAESMGKLATTLLVASKRGKSLNRASTKANTANDYSAEAEKIDKLNNLSSKDVAKKLKEYGAFLKDETSVEFHNGIAQMLMLAYRDELVEKYEKEGFSNTKIHDELLKNYKQILKMSNDDILAKLDEVFEEKKLGNLLLRDMYIYLTDAELFNVQYSNLLIKSLQKAGERNTQSSIKRAQGGIRTLNRNLTHIGKKIVVENSNDLLELNKDGEIQIKNIDQYKSVYRGKLVYDDKLFEQANNLAETVYTISMEVRSNKNAYLSEANYKKFKAGEKNRQKRETAINKKLAQDINKQMDKLLKLEEQNAYNERRALIVGRILNEDGKEANKNNVPEAIYDLFTILSKTELYAREYNSEVTSSPETIGDKKLMINQKKFLNITRDFFKSLNDTNVHEMLDYILTHQFMDKLTDAVMELSVAVINAQFFQGVSSYVLTQEEVEKISKWQSDISSIGAQRMNVAKFVKHEINPIGTVINDMVTSNGLVISTDTERYLQSEVEKALASGNYDGLSEVIKNVSLNIAKENPNNPKLLTTLWKIQQTFMLSGPGTAIRNKVSNALVTVGNKASDVIGKVLAGKTKHVEGQYVLTGTKVDQETKNFVQAEVLDSGFLALIEDGVSKYNPRSSTSTKNKSKEEIVTSMITDAIISKLNTNFWNRTGDAKGARLMMDKFSKFVMKMLSDDKAIRKRFTEYLGKMLTEDGVDLTDGLTQEVLIRIADAYKLAADDYMHKANFFTKLEQLISQRLGTAGFFMYKQLFPFAAASWNWFVEGLKYTPVGLAKGIYQLAKLDRTIEKMENAEQKGERVISSRFAEFLAKRNIGKGVIGSITMTLGILLSVFGKAAIDDEDDKVKLIIFGDGETGGIKLDVSDVFGSTGIMLGMAMVCAFKGKSFNEFADAFASVLDTFFLDSTFSDTFNNFRYSDTFGDWLLDEMFNSFSTYIPNLWKQITKYSSPYNTNYEKGIVGKLERIGEKIFTNWLLPHKIDPYTGEDQVKNKAWYVTNIVNALSPAKITTFNVSEQEKKAIKLGINRSNLTCNYEINGNRVKLGSATISKTNTLYGKLNKIELEQLISNQVAYRVQDKNGKFVTLKYSKMTDKQKKNVIERIMNNNASIAKVYALTSKGYKYYTTADEKASLSKYGIKSNVIVTNKEGLIGNYKD